MRPVAFDPSNFGPRSHDVNHPYFNLQTGTTRVYVGRSDVTGETLPHTVSFTTTDLTKVVDGVSGRVLWDVDESNGQVAEAELAIFAQDLDGNVWNLGEYPEEYPNGLFIGAPQTWFQGIEDAEAGIHMLASPDVGTLEYVQGSVPSIEFLDCATIVERGLRMCVPIGCFDDVLVVHERSPLDPAGGVQVKYHAPGIGIIAIGAIGDPEAETLELAELKTLTPSELQAADIEARILDQRGRQCDDVYKQTEPLTGPHDGDYGPYTCGVPEPPPPRPLVTGTSAPAFAGRPPTPTPTPPPTAPPVAPPEPQYVSAVDHPLFPLARLRRTVHRGTDRGVPVEVSRRVRHSSALIAGVRVTTVVRTTRRNGAFVRRATEHYAQDPAGNVWLLGRSFRNRDGRRGAWIAGRDGARRALIMPAQTDVGRTFLRPRSPGIGEMRSSVISDGAEMRTLAGRFTRCVLIRHTAKGWGPVLRMYCRNVGLVDELAGNRRLQLARLARAPR